MNIAFLTSEYPHAKTTSSGGIGTSIYNLSRGLMALGHKVTVLLYGQENEEIFIDQGITIYKIKNVIVKGFSFYFTQKKLQKIINSLIVKGEIDILEAPDWTGVTAFINVNCPVVIRLNGSDTYFCYLDKRPVKFKNRFFEKSAIKKADGIISVSKYTGELTNQIFNLDKEFTVIPNSINVSNFEASNNTKSDVVLYFGTLIRKKGLLELPHIFNQVYNQNQKARLLLIGKDAGDVMSGTKSTWEMMKPLFLKEAIKNVTYLGEVPYNQIKSQIEQATLCVFPTFAEALPVSWIEAMAMQKPIVASNIGWATEIVDDGKNGFLVHPKDHNEFADKINSVLANPNLQNQLGVEARKKIIKKFSIEIVAKQSIDFYQKFLNN